MGAMQTLCSCVWTGSSNSCHQIEESSSSTVHKELCDGTSLQDAKSSPRYRVLHPTTPIGLGARRVALSVLRFCSWVGSSSSHSPRSARPRCRRQLDHIVLELPSESSSTCMTVPAFLSAPIRSHAT